LHFLGVGQNLEIDTNSKQLERLERAGLEALDYVTGKTEEPAGIKQLVRLSFSRYSDVKEKAMNFLSQLDSLGYCKMERMEVREQNGNALIEMAVEKKLSKHVMKNFLDQQRMLNDYPKVDQIVQDEIDQLDFCVDSAKENIENDGDFNGYAVEIRVIINSLNRHDIH